MGDVALGVTGECGAVAVGVGDAGELAVLIPAVMAGGIVDSFGTAEEIALCVEGLRDYAAIGVRYAHGVAVIVALGGGDAADGILVVEGQRALI